MKRSGASAGYVGRGPSGTLTEQDARELLAEFSTSGLSLAAFARARGLHPQRLGWWKTQLARRAAQPEPAPSELPAAPTFLPIHVAAPAPVARLAVPFEVVLPDGRIVRVPQDFAAPALAELLAVLGAAR